MKEYRIQLDDSVANELDEIATIQKVPPEIVVQLLVVKALAPFHKLAKGIDGDEE